MIERKTFFVLNISKSLQATLAGDEQIKVSRYWKVNSLQNGKTEIKNQGNLEGCGRAVAQAVSRRPLAAEARVRARVTASGSGQSGNRTGISHSSSIYPVSILPPRLSILICRLGDEQ
jgi:hypothetical protein